MAEKKKDRNNEQTGAIIRRRLIGAAAMLLFAFVLWHLGESAPPAQVNIPAPQAEEWQTPQQSEVLREAQTRLADGDAVMRNIDNTADDDDNNRYDGGGDAAVVVDVFVAEDIDATLAAEVADGDNVESGVKGINNEVNTESENDKADDNHNEVASADADVNTPTLPEVAIAKPSTKPSPADEDTGIAFSAGVFAKPKNAEALAAKIKAAGLQAQIRPYQTADNKPLQQVRVINLPDDDAKVAAKETVKKLAKTPPKKTSLFVVQIGAFTNPSKAKDMADKLKGGGYTIRISETRRNGVLLHRVRAVGYQTRADAEEAKRNLRASGNVDAQVIDLR